MILTIIMCTSTDFYNLAISIAFFNVPVLCTLEYRINGGGVRIIGGGGGLEMVRYINYRGLE